MPSSPITSAALSRLQDRLGLWPVRVLWLGLPLAAGDGIRALLDRFESPGPVIATVALWTAWFAGMVAALVPSPLSLTGIRTLSSGAVALLGLAAVATSDASAAVLAAVGAAGLACAASYLPVVGDRMINGSAYGSERRMALRPPAFALLGPIQLAWAAVFAGLVTGPWLLAAGRYVAGGLATVVGAGAVGLGFRAMHQLARRWLVFVPAGFVIHDHVMLVESVLLRRATLEALGPAVTPLADGVIDLSGGAYGLALQATLAEPASFGRRQRREVHDVAARQLVFTPSLPGAVLVEARARAIPIGQREGI